MQFLPQRLLSHRESNRRESKRWESHRRGRGSRRAQGNTTPSRGRDGRAPMPPADATTPLVATAITRRYGRHVALQPTSLTIRPGEFVAIMGPSGAGKTTLLNILSGLDRPSSGSINAPQRTNRAFVFQDYNLLESLSAARNAELTARLSGRPCSRSQRTAIFHSLGLDSMERRLPWELSGGQQQRVAVARALLAQAPFIFADEPTGALDDATAAIVLEHLRAAASAGSSVIMVTHQHSAAQVADRIITIGAASEADSTEAAAIGATSAEAASGAAPPKPAPPKAAPSAHTASPRTQHESPAKGKAGGQR